MHPAIRTQVDQRQEEFSFLSATDNSHLPDLARQEFREEVDVNNILARFGMNIPIQRQPQFGEVDFDLDLHSAHIARERAQFAFTQLPHELREKYRTTAKMLDAMNTGELATDLKAAQDKEKAARTADKPSEGPSSPETATSTPSA